MERRRKDKGYMDKSIREFLKPGWKKMLLTVILLFLTGCLFFMIFLLNVQIPKGLTILRILGLPFTLLLTLNPNLLYLFEGTVNLAGITFFILTIFWLYVFSCILIFLKNLLFSIKWDVKKLSFLVVLFLVGTIAYGFSNLGFGDIFVPTADESGATLEGITEIVKANNKFATEFYSEIRKDSNENIFFSPWSISNAIAMTYEGARGKTADEIQSVFHFSKDDEVRRSSFARMLNMISKTGGKYELHTANAMWLQKDYPFLEEYKNIIKRYYLGEVENLDFIDTIGSSNKINDWVAKHTNGKIERMVSPDMFDELTRVVLTNAIYFNGKWEHQFDEKETKLEDFTLNSGEKIKVPMMRLENDDLEFNYTEADGIQILEMNYQGEKISMLILLPRGSITHLESILNEKKLQEWKSMLKLEKVYIYLPKFKFEASYSLEKYLKKLGMKLSFAPEEADFSGIDGTKKLFLKDVLHKAYINVYEKGTEAAAVTVATITLTSIPHIITFRADHPFIFIIQERSTGNILFIGRVMRPVEKH